jgi:amidohydrolase
MYMNLRNIMNKSITGATLIALSLLATTAHAQNTAWQQTAESLQPKLTTWRRHLHQYPELSNREVNTAAYITKHLQSLGLEVRTGIAKTGVVAILKGGKPGPVIALRADIDALPVVERNSLPYASKVTTEFNGQKVGVMHACGHDTHTAILMGTAETLTKHKAQIQGTVVFIFQPAEEGAPEGEEGGAALMVKEGVLDNPKVEAAFGLHISSSIPVGEIRYKPGGFMASADLFKVKVKGKGSHGSQPWLAVDPIVIASQIVNNLQTIVSRQSNIVKAPVVVTVGAIHSGVRFNIIPEEAELLGTIRTLDKEERLKVLAQVKKTAEETAALNGGTAEVTIENKTLITFNDSALVQSIVPSLEKAVGKTQVAPMNWVTGAEDFSFFADKVPSFFFYFGGMPAGTDAAKAAPHHTADFIVDDSKLYNGVKSFCQIVFDYPNRLAKN